jgi:hypothetical protein
MAVLVALPILWIVRYMHRNAKMDAEADIIIADFLREYSGQLERAYEIMLPDVAGMDEEIAEENRALRFSDTQPEAWDAEAYALINDALQTLEPIWFEHFSSVSSHFAMRDYDKTGDWTLAIDVYSGPRIQTLLYSPDSKLADAQTDAPESQLPPGWSSFSVVRG